MVRWFAWFAFPGFATEIRREKLHERFAAIGRQANLSRMAASSMSLIVVSLLLGAIGLGEAIGEEGSQPPGENAAKASVKADAKAETLTLRGRVGWMREVLQRRFGVLTVPESQERILCLETVTGEVYPIAEDIRGRAFRVDERLRNLQVEMEVRRHLGSPMIQVIRLYELRDNQRWELDYWCEICAIAMFELKACDCCQGPIDLRRRRSF